jgi:hypothetical protein
MGEFAGYALDDAIDAENDRWLYRQGVMSDADAFDLGIIDHRGGYRHVPMYPAASSKTCRHCGVSGLVWRQTDGGWRLHAGAELHACDGYARRIVTRRAETAGLRGEAIEPGPKDAPN